MDSKERFSYLQRELRRQFKKDLESQIGTQIDRLMELGYHRFLFPEIDEWHAKKKYRENFALSKNLKLIQMHNDTFPIPLIIDPRIALFVQNKKAGIAEFVPTNSIKDEIALPEQPFLIFTHDGSRYRGYSMMDEAKEGETWCTQLEATSLYLHRPEIFNMLSLFAPTSRLGGIPTRISMYYGRPELHVASRGFPNAFEGALSRASQIILLGKDTPRS